MNLHKKTRVYFFAILVSLSFVFSCTVPQQQPGYIMYPDVSVKEKFFADPVVFFETDSLNARLDLYIEIPFDNILFKKNFNTEKYETVISLSVAVKDALKKTVLENIYYDSLSFTNDQMTVKSKESLYYFYNYPVEPGKYYADIMIKNSNSKEEYKKTLDISVKDLKSEDITSSDPMILSKYKVNDNGTKEITPLISKNIFGLKEFFVFTEIYNNTNEDITKEYIFRLTDVNDKLVKENNVTYTLSPGKNQKIENFLLPKEMKKYYPDEPDFDFFLYDNYQNLSFKIEIIDKSNNISVVNKKLLFLPSKPYPPFDKRLHMR